MENIYRRNIAQDYFSYPILQGSFNPTELTTNLSSIAFKPDGLKFYLCDRANSIIYQYSCSVAFDITTATYDSVSFTLTQGTNLEQIKFNDDGTKLYTAMNSNDAVYQYSLPTPYLISSLIYDSKSLSASDTNLCGVAFGNNRLIMACNGSDLLKEFLFSNNDISTATNPFNFDFNPPFGDIQNITFADNGNILLCNDASNKVVYWLHCPIAYSLQNSSFIGSFITNIANNIKGLELINNNFYITTNEIVYWYKL